MPRRIVKDVVGITGVGVGIGVGSTILAGQPGTGGAITALGTVGGFLGPIATAKIGLSTMDIMKGYSMPKKKRKYV